MSKVVFTPSPYNNNLQCTLNRGERMTAFETARAFKKHWLRWLNIAPKHLESNENNEMQQCLHFATLKQQYNHSQELDTFNSFPMTNNDLAHQDTLDRDTDDQQQNRPGLTTSSLPNHLTERTPKVNFVKSNFSISKVNFSSSTEPLYSEKKLANDTDPVPVAEKVLYLAHSGIIRQAHRLNDGTLLFKQSNRMIHTEKVNSLQLLPQDLRLVGTMWCKAAAHHRSKVLSGRAQYSNCRSSRKRFKNQLLSYRKYYNWKLKKQEKVLMRKQWQHARWLSTKIKESEEINLKSKHCELETVVINNRVPTGFSDHNVEVTEHAKDTARMPSILTCVKVGPSARIGRLAKRFTAAVKRIGKRLYRSKPRRRRSIRKEKNTKNDLFNVPAGPVGTNDRYNKDHSTEQKCNSIQQVSTVSPTDTTVDARSSVLPAQSTHVLRQDEQCMDVPDRCSRPIHKELKNVDSIHSKPSPQPTVDRPRRSFQRQKEQLSSTVIATPKMIHSPLPSNPRGTTSLFVVKKNQRKNNSKDHAVPTLCDLEADVYQTLASETHRISAGREERMDVDVKIGNNYRIEKETTDVLKSFSPSASKDPMISRLKRRRRILSGLDKEDSHRVVLSKSQPIPEQKLLFDVETGNNQLECMSVEDGESMTDEGSTGYHPVWPSGYSFLPENYSDDPAPWAPEVNVAMGRSERPCAVLYDPLFDISVGTLTMEGLADTGCIYYAKSLLSERYYQKIKKHSQQCILSESPTGNNATLSAAGKSTLEIITTVRLRMLVPHEDRKNPGRITQREMVVEACVIKSLGRPFILANRDLALDVHELVFEQAIAPGHITFRNYRNEQGHVDLEHGQLTDDLRIPLSKSAERRITRDGSRVKRKPKACCIRTTGDISLKPNKKVFYTVPLPGESFNVEPPHRKGTSGSFRNPLKVEVDGELAASSEDQYIVSTLDGEDTWSTIADEPYFSSAMPWTQTSVIQQGANTVILENRSSDIMFIPEGTIISHIERVEDIYSAEEVGCIALDIGKLLATASKTNATEEASEPPSAHTVTKGLGVDTEVMVDQSDYDVPLPLGPGNFEKVPFPWMDNDSLEEMKKHPNYRAPSQADKDEMIKSKMWKEMHDTDLWSASSRKDQQALEQVLLDYSFIFTKKFAAGTVPRDLAEHDIELKEDIIIRSRQYPLTKSSRDEISTWIRTMLNNGFIRPSNSPFRSPLLVVAKLTSDGKVKGWRVCFDGRRINAMTKSYVGNPPPSTEQIFNDVTGGKLFSVTDFSNGFYNVQMTDRAARICAFADPTDGRLFEFIRLPMGLIGSPATFARLGSLAFHELISTCLQIYVDDICCYTTLEHVNEENAIRKKRGEKEMITLIGVHALQLEAMLQRCCKAGLLCSLKKTSCALPKVSLLGHEVSCDGLRPCSMKTIAMREAPAPTDVSGIRRIMGCFSYYRRFIPRFTDSTKHIRSMLKKGVHFKWTPEMQHEYDVIKGMLASEPLVCPPDYTKKFYVMTDGSKVGLAGVVYQLDEDGKQQVVGYWSRSLTSAEQNYDAREIETLAILGTLTKYRAILPTEFTLYTDHLNLLKLSTYVSHKTRLSSWANRLSVWQPVIKHIAGSKNVVADWMSRAPWRPSVAPLIACIDGKNINNNWCVSHDPNAFQKVTTGKETHFWVEKAQNQLNRWTDLSFSQSLFGSGDEHVLFPQTTTTANTENCEECARARLSTWQDLEATKILGMGKKPPHHHCHHCGAVAREDRDHICGNCTATIPTLEITSKWVECPHGAVRVEGKNAKPDGFVMPDGSDMPRCVRPNCVKQSERWWKWFSAHHPNEAQANMIFAAPPTKTVANTNVFATKQDSLPNKRGKPGSKGFRISIPVDIKKSQEQDEELQRILWYKDLGPALKRDKQRCMRGLKAAMKRWLKSEKRTDFKINSDNTNPLLDDKRVLGPFASLEDLQAKSATMLVEKGMLRLTHRPRKGVMSKTSEGYKDKLLNQDENELISTPMCVGKSLIQDLLWWYHDSHVGNHDGTDQTFAQLSQRFYWSTMYKDAQDYINNCLRCRQAKQTSRVRWLSLGQAPPPLGIYYTVFLDVVCVSSGDSGVTSRRGHTHVLSIQDRLCGHVNFIPIRLKFSDEQKKRRKKRKVAARSAKGKRKLELSTEDVNILDERAAVVVATAFYQRVCLQLHKKPHILVCDNGTEFKNELLKELSRLMNIRVFHTAPENPRANYVERCHSVLGQRLRILVNDPLFPDHRSWDRYLPYIEHAMNNRTIVDRLSPANCMFGRTDNLKVDELDKKISLHEAMGQPMPSERKALAKHAHKMLERQEIASSRFSQHLLYQQELRLRRFKRKRYHEYYPGDLVLLLRRNVGKTKNRTSSKLNLKWSGPHEILENVNGSGVYKLRLYNSSTVLKAPANLLAPLSKDIVARPAQRTLWDNTTPRSAADLFPVQGDKLVMISLPKHVKKTIARVKGSMEFYVVEYVRGLPSGDDGEKWEVILMGHTVARASAKAKSSHDSPLESKHYPAWVKAGEGKKKIAEIKYSKSNLEKDGFELLKFNITDEVVLPVTQFHLTDSSTIPAAVKERINLLLCNRVEDNNNESHFIQGNNFE